MTKRMIDLRTDEEKAEDLLYENTRCDTIPEVLAKIEAEVVAKGECPGCDNPADDEDTCPFNLEIYDISTLCKCCDDCRHQCALEI